MGITLRNGIQINKVKTPPIYEGPTVFSDDQLIKVGGKYVTTDLQIDLNTDERIVKDNLIQMKGVDLTEINYEGGYEFGSERDYVEAQPMFQYWANVILFGNEEPQPLPDLPTLQTKVVEPKTTEQEVTADTGYELEKVIVLGADVVETITQQNYDLMHFMDYFKYVAQGIPMASDAEYMAAEEYCQNKIISIYGGANGQN